MAHPNQYTDPEKAFLEKHWPTESVEWIGEQLGRSATSVRQHADRMGLPRKPGGKQEVIRADDGRFVWSDTQIDLLTMMWRNGYDTRVIAERLGAGMTRNAVIGKAKRLGLGPHPNAKAPAPPPRVQKLPPAKACQWPIGHPGTPGFRFCGKPVATDKPHRSYCPRHCAVAYRRPKPQEAAEIVAIKKRLKRVA